MSSGGGPDPLDPPPYLRHCYYQIWDESVERHKLSTKNLYKANFCHKQYQWVTNRDGRVVRLNVRSQIEREGRNHCCQRRQPNYFQMAVQSVITWY
jgi:hypothetical protein